MIADKHKENVAEIAAFIKTSIDENYGSMREFCRIHGFSRTGLSDFLSGKSVVRVNTLMSYLDALGCTIELQCGEYVLKIEK